MNTLIFALSLLLNSYCSDDCNTAMDWIEMSGHAVNEAVCLNDPHKFDPSCIAYCEATFMWLDYDDIIESQPVCKDILGERN